MLSQPIALFDYVNPFISSNDSIFDAYGGFGGFIGFLLLSALISFVFYIVPVLIYRFGIRKQPIQPRMKAQGITFLFFICSMVALHLFNLLLASASGDEIDSIQLGLLDVICYIVNSFLLMYEGKSSETPASFSSAGTDNEAERWKKQYFDLYTQTQKSAFSDSIIDGLSEQEIEQVRQYVDYLKKSKFKINPITDSDSPAPDDDTPPSPVQPVQPAEISHKEARETYIMKSQLDEETAKIRQKEVEQINKKADIILLIIGISLFVFMGIIVAIGISYSNGYWA